MINWLYWGFAAVQAVVAMSASLQPAYDYAHAVAFWYITGLLVYIAILDWRLWKCIDESMQLNPNAAPEPKRGDT